MTIITNTRRAELSLSEFYPCQGYGPDCLNDLEHDNVKSYAVWDEDELAWRMSDEELDSLISYWRDAAEGASRGESCEGLDALPDDEIERGVEWAFEVSIEPAGEPKNEMSRVDE